MAEHLAIPISPQAFDELEQVIQVLQPLSINSQTRQQKDAWPFFRQNGT
jgi:hypothetical protein